MERLEKKFDGTYDEDAEKAEASKGPIDDPELQGRLNASIVVASEKFGEDFIEKQINDPDSDYQNLRKKMPHIDVRAKNADLPFVEAVQILKEEQFFDKYGRDPDKIIEKIKEEIEPELRKAITKEIQEKIGKSTSIPNGISGVKGAVTAKSTEGNGFKPRSTADLLG